MELAGPLAITHVDVLNPGREALLEQTVLVVDGRFTRISDAAPPAGYRVIDATNQWLMPGLIDAHIHLIDEADMAALLAHGVTTARNMLGRPVHLALREAVAQGELAGPRLLSASRTLNTTDESGTFHDMVHSPEQARQAVRQAKRDGYDLIKVYAGLSQPIFRAIVAEAQALGLPIAGHPPKQVPIEEFLVSSVSVEHVEELWQKHLRKADDSQVRALAEQIAASGKPLVATLEVVQRLADVCGGGDAALDRLASPLLNPLYQWIGSRSLGDWVDEEDLASCQRWSGYTERMVQIVAIMHQSGVAIALGSDSGPHRTVHGLTTHLEIARLDQAGLSATDVLIAATVHSARVLQHEAELGAIAPGYLADALLLAADPRSDLSLLSDPDGILAAGRWYDRPAREALLAAAEQHAGFILSIGRLLQ